MIYGRSKKNFIFCFNLISRFKFGTQFKVQNASIKYKSGQQIIVTQEFTFTACFEKGNSFFALAK